MLRLMETVRRGRHLEASRNDEALLDAARVVFAVYGAEAPVSLIAERAGTGIASLYRRYPTKGALLQHLCLAAMAQTIEAADEALSDADPWRGLRLFLETCAAARYGAFVAIGGTIATTDEMNRTFKRSQDKLDEIVARAQAGGQLRGDVNAIDLRLLIELFSRRPPDDETYRRSLGIALDGLRPPRRKSALAGDPPTWSEYVARWHASVPQRGRAQTEV
jgi:AcrR family transcriptional regulator